MKLDSFNPGGPAPGARRSGTPQHGGDSFADRVQALRDSWAERRQVKDLAGAHDFDSQFLLLLTLHGWALQAMDEIHAVYAGSFRVAVSPVPLASDLAPAFSVAIADSHTASFSLTERRRMGGSRWFIAVSLATAGPVGGVAPASPERRNGQWTRARLEEVLLSVLGAYERSLADLEPPASRARGA